MVATATRTDQATLLVEQVLSVMAQDNLSQANAVAEVLSQHKVDEETTEKMLYHGLYALSTIALGIDRRQQGQEPETNGTTRSGGGRGARRSAIITYIETVLGQHRIASADGGSTTLLDASDADLVLLRSQFTAQVAGFQCKIDWIDQARAALLQHKASRIKALPAQVREDLASQKSDVWKVETN